MKRQPNYEIEKTSVPQYKKTASAGKVEGSLNTELEQETEWIF